MKHIDFLQSLTPGHEGPMLTFDASRQAAPENLFMSGNRILPEPLPAGHFRLGQNFPNPHYGLTTIPVTLSVLSDVQIELYSLEGNKVKMIFRPALRAGDHTILVDLAALGLPSGDYIYQLQASNHHGVFRHSRVMQAAE